MKTYILVSLGAKKVLPHLQRFVKPNFTTAVSNSFSL